MKRLTNVHSHKISTNNKVNLATLAFGATLAQIKRDVKQVEVVMGILCHFFGIFGPF